MTGKVRRILRDRNYGFIENGESQYFFHKDDLTNIKFEDLREGQNVSFERAATAPRGPRASNVQAL